jgi:hypothetical protein
MNLQRQRTSQHDHCQQPQKRQGCSCTASRCALRCLYSVHELENMLIFGLACRALQPSSGLIQVPVLCAKCAYLSHIMLPAAAIILAVAVPPATLVAALVAVWRVLQINHTEVL